LNALLDTSFYRLGIWGIPLATSLVNVVGAVTLYVLLRRRVGLEHLGRTIGVILRVTAASAVAAFAGFLAWSALDSVLGESFTAQLVCIGTGLAAATVVYAAASRALGVRELDALLLLRGRRETPPE
jgi:putative peptidoglycan lipid II flippase